MKVLVSVLVGLVVRLMLPAQSPHESNSSPFVGRWDCTLHTPIRDYPTWLEFSAGASGELQGRMVGRWGHAHPVLNLRVEDGELEFESPKNQESLPVDMEFRLTLQGSVLKGNVLGVPDAPWSLIGNRAPALPSASEPHWGKPIALFDGRDLQGWTFTKPESATNWSAKDGVLKTSFRGSELVSTQKFGDFKLHTEFRCEPKCNSGIYLRGRYEVQIADATSSVTADRRSAAVYGFIAPNTEVEIRPGEWQSYDIMLVGRTVTLSWNGKVVIDHKEIPGITGGALDSDEGAPGPIYLQGSEQAGGTEFRNVMITPAFHEHP